MWRSCFVLAFFILDFSPICFTQGTWVQKSNVFSAGRAGAVGFSIGRKGYLGTGWQFGNNICYNDFWEWDQATDIWTQKANFPSVKRGDAVGFSIGTKGYIATGRDDNANSPNDFWEWDQATNKWSGKANFSGGSRAFAIGLSIGSKGYIGTGSGPTKSDFWEWDPATNVWTQKANFGGGDRAYAIAFAIGNKGYAGLGRYVSDCIDLWEFDPIGNIWTQKANFPGAPRSFAASFSIGTKGYFGTGADYGSTVYNDFWEWDQPTNTWTRKADYPHPVSDIDHGAFSIGCHGYLAGGSDNPGGGGVFFNDFWEYTPDYIMPIVPGITAQSTICNGSNIVLLASGGIYYSWSTGDTLSSINVSPTVTTSYSVTIQTDCANAAASTTVTVINSGTAFFSYEYEPCKSKCVSLMDQSANAFTWNWDFGDGIRDTSPKPCHFYNDSATYNVSLIINQLTSCADTFIIDIPYTARDTSAFVYIPNAFSPNGDESNDRLQFFRKDTFCLKEFSISIYDRWGEKVFETMDINDSWNGLFNNEALDAAVYTYYCRVVTITGLQKMQKGNVSLIR